MDGVVAESRGAASRRFTIAGCAHTGRKYAISLVTRHAGPRITSSAQRLLWLVDQVTANLIGDMADIRPITARATMWLSCDMNQLPTRSNQSKTHCSLSRLSGYKS